ncbi:ATP-binding cassette domain-containing protein [Rhodococcus sp. USK10]|uniref:ABC transporter ATP-binding protein n=1 Tax=Rhodococcus sp. USK10 TaxID=2789739 RepID=UPI001C5DA166|nr:ATP-binding cassette domain-containing protein [Rhodococcus sp. USK10]QYB07403.1 ATP-binding cassette domain-containing protein [Rhodococcus sp. USK10]
MTTHGEGIAVHDLSVHFGGVTAVDQVSFEIAAGEIVGLIGPNGSGKTTLLNALTGVVPAYGTLTAGGRAIKLGRPSHSRRARLIRVFQAPQLCPNLSCVENVMLGAAEPGGRTLASAWFRRPAMWRHETGRLADARSQLARVGLPGADARPAGQLTYGEQRLLELARALTGAPRVLMLDEPSAGLNDAETRNLHDLLIQIRNEGTTILVVDHKIDFIDSLCDRILVLEVGRLIAQGIPSQVWADDRVMDAYLGVAHDA